jgi:hypothetical protein
MITTYRFVMTDATARSLRSLLGPVASFAGFARSLFERETALRFCRGDDQP